MIIFYETVALSWKTLEQEREWKDLIKEIKTERIEIAVKPHPQACTISLSFTGIQFYEFSVRRNKGWRERLLKNLKGYHSHFFRLVESEKVAWRLE